MSDQTTDGIQPALLFIPDISGFTQFVQATEIAHSRHIIEELLEKLIDANSIGLQVSEVEGDAILFYRFGTSPTAEEFFQQVRDMFVAFHGHLRLYETRRICQCGACTGAQNLTLKIVAHYGHITRSRIREHEKLFGQDVITVHRLLKNNIAHHEYALFTQTLMNAWPLPAAPGWAAHEEGSHEYDVGKISYCHVPLAPLRRFVPEPRAEDFSITGATVPVFSFEQFVHAPLSLVFDAATDLPTRLQWMQGAKRVEMKNDQLNRVGTKHRCVIDNNSPVMVTSSSTRTGNSIAFTETDEKKMMCSVYTLRQEGDMLTRLRIDGFIKNNPVVRLMFALLLKKKVGNLFRASTENLKRYCEELYKSQQAQSRG